MKKILSILAMCAMPLIVTSCAKNPTEPDDQTTTANQQQVQDSCVKIVPGTVIEIREIREDDDCTCKLIREGGDDDDRYESDDDDRFGHKHHHDNGKHKGHYKNKHKHKKHNKYYRKASDERKWVIVIVPQCGDSAKYTIVCSRDGRIVEIKSQKPACSDSLRPADSCVTYKTAEDAVTTQKKGGEIKEWEVEQNPATKDWKYYFTVEDKDKLYLVAVDGRTGTVVEDKEITD